MAFNYIKKGLKILAPVITPKDKFNIFVILVIRFILMESHYDFGRNGKMATC